MDGLKHEVRFGNTRDEKSRTMACHEVCRLYVKRNLKGAEETYTNA